MLSIVCISQRVLQLGLTQSVFDGNIPAEVFMSQSQDQSALETLRKKFIVADADFVQEQLASLVEKTAKFCVLDERGNVHIRRKDLPQGKRVGLCLLARFIASRMDKKFSPELCAEEVAGFAGLGKAEVAARAKELVDNGFALRAGKGKYRANAARVDDFLATLDG